MTANVIGALVIFGFIALWAAVLYADAVRRDVSLREQYESRWVEALEENDGYGHDR